MTPNDVLTEIRSAISDESNVRWSDSILRGYMLAGEVEIVRSHPEAQYITRVSNSTPVLLSDNTMSLTISIAFRMALIHYVAFRVFSEDSDDAKNADNAKSNYSLFEGSMK